MGFPTKWLPSAALGVCLFPLLVTAWVPQPTWGGETQDLTSARIWVPQHGSSPPGLHFEKFDTRGGTRELRAISARVRSQHEIFLGIEVLDDAPVTRWWTVGSSPDRVCDPGDPMACDGAPGLGPWCKTKLVSPGRSLTLAACTAETDLRVISAVGPHDGTDDLFGPSGGHDVVSVDCLFSTDGRITDPEVLAPFIEDGSSGAPWVSVHLGFTYGGVNRWDAQSPGAPPGAEAYNVSTEYDLFSRSAVTLTYWYTE